MSGEETTIRSLASESRVNSKWLKTGMLQTANFIAISKTTGRLAGLRSCSMTMGIRVRPRSAPRLDDGGAIHRCSRLATSAE